MGELQRAAAVRQTAQPSMRSRDASPRGPRGRHSERELTAVPLYGLPAPRALQPALAIGAADDPFEREAERTADAVMASPEGPSRALGGGSIAASLLRFVRRALGKGESPAKKDEDERKRLQKAPAAAGPGQEVVPAAVESGIQRMSAGGEPLSPSLRSFFEPRFGYDFGGVRLHTGGEAAGAAVALGARAFTVDDHVFFGAGEYQPSSASGQRLIAHELTHTIQQKPAAARAARLLPAPRRVQRDWLPDPRAAALAKVREWANELPPYELLTVLLGRDPITDKPVERSARNWIRAALKLVPKGMAIFDDLEKTKTIEKTAAWFRAEVAKLNLTWNGIKALFRQAWDSIGFRDLLSPSRVWEKVKAAFAPTLNRLVEFSLAMGRKALEFVFEGAMLLAGSVGKQIVEILHKIGDGFGKIVEDLSTFGRNLMRAVSMGFQQFVTNIWAHLTTGFTEWLTGSLQEAGLSLPKAWDAKGILSLVLQVLGITYQKMRVKLVKMIGEKPVSWIEAESKRLFPFFEKLMREGPVAAYEAIVATTGSLWNLVIGGIKEWAITRIVTVGIARLVFALVPGGAAIMLIYNAIALFVERFKQIRALAEAVFDSIANVTAGKIADAANSIERAMAKTIPVILAFLSRLLGLGDVSAGVKKVIIGIQGKIDKAIDNVIAFIADKVKGLFKSVTGGVKKVIDWWRARKKFHTADGEDHEVGFDGEGSSAELVVSNSSPKKMAAHFAAWQASIDSIKGNPTKKTAQEQALADARTKDDRSKMLQKELAAPIAKGAVESGRQEKVAQLSTVPSELAPILALHDVKDSPTEPIYGGLSPRGYGTSVYVEKLSSKPTGGSAPSVSSEFWKRLGQRRNDNSPRDYYYVRGHLLNSNLGGPGRTWENLTPLTQVANNRGKESMLRQFENPVKDAIKGGKVVTKFDVKAEYGAAARATDLAEIDSALKAARDPKEHKKLEVVREVVEEEQYVAMKVKCEAVIAGTSLTADIDNDYRGTKWRNYNVAI